MIFEQLSGNLLQGLLLGAVYGVATMGLSLIFGVLKVVNVGHGAFIMTGAFATLALFTGLGISPLAAVPIALVIGLALGFLIFYTVIRRVLKATELASLLATFALGILLQEIVRLVFGSEWQGYTWDAGSVDLGFTALPLTKIYAFAGSILVALALYFWFSRSRAGQAIRAVVADNDGARVCGINVNRTYALSFAVGIGLTVMSGTLLTLFIPVGINPYMGGTYTLKAFVIAVLGGMGSPYGAFFGGLIFGLVENGAYVIFGLVPSIEPFAMTRFFTFMVLLGILLIRPKGLMGSKE